MKKIILISFLLSFFISFSQNFESIINQAISKQKELSNYKLEMIYTIYADSISNVKKDEQRSEFIKKDKSCYFKMAESEIIFTEDFYIKISHSEKIMLYSNINESYSDFTERQNPFSEFIDKFKIKEIKDIGRYWECTLAEPNDIQIPFNKIILQIQKNDFNIIKQIYYFNTSIEKSLNNSALNTKNERLEIKQLNFQESSKTATDLFSIEKYLIQTGDSFTNTNYTKGYKILMQ
jgi:hypothetical protein